MPPSPSLYFAASQGDIESLKKHLSRPMFLCFGSIPFGWVNERCLLEAYSHDVRGNIRHLQNQTPLICAIPHDHIDTVKFLVEVAGATDLKTSGVSILAFAAGAGALKW